MLKQVDDGLTKVWKVDKACEPFYNGGKLSVSREESDLFCIFEDNLMILNNGDNTTTKLFSGDGEEEINCFCVHPNGEEVVVATKKSLLKHYKLSDKICNRTIKAHQMPILAMCYDPTGTLVATGSADRSVRVWDIEKGYCTHSFKGHTDIVSMVYFHPDSARLQLFSSGDDNTTRVFSLASQSCLATFRDHVSLVTQVAVSPDGNILVSAGRDKVLNFYELISYKHIKTVPIMEELEGVVTLSREHSKELLGEAAPLKKVGGMSSGASGPFVLLCAGEKGIVRLFNVSCKSRDAASFSITPLLEFSLKVSPLASSISPSSASASSLSSVVSLIYLPKKKEIMAVTQDYNLCFYSLSSIQSQIKASGSGAAQQFLKPQKLLIGSHGDILDMSLLPARVANNTSDRSVNMDGYELALVTNSSQVRIIDDSFSCRLLEGHTDIVLSVSSSPDGTWLVTSSKDRRCLLWHVPSGDCVAVGEGHTDSVGSVAMSQSKASYASRNVFAVSGGADRILKRWGLPVHTLLSQVGSSSSSSAGTTTSTNSRSLAALKATHSVRAHDKDINSVASSPNDALVASGSQDKTIRLWASIDLTPVATLKGHKRGIWKVVFSPVDKVLVSCSGDRTLRLWSVVDYSSLRIFEGHTASVLSVKFVNGGTQLMSCSADGLVRLWTVRSGECVNTFDEHEDKVWALEHRPAVTVGAVGSESGEDLNAAMGAASGPAQPAIIFSAGSDSRLLVWCDHTAQEEQKRVVALEENLLLEQQLHSDMKNRKYGDALSIALRLGHSMKVLTILNGVLEDEKEALGMDGAAVAVAVAGSLPDVGHKLDKYVAALDEEQLTKVVNYLSEWNTNSKHGFVSQMLISSLLRVVRVDRLQGLRPILEKCAGLLAYSERHFNRIDRLYQATYLIDYIASSISLQPEDSASAVNSSSNSSSKKNNSNDKRSLASPGDMKGQPPHKIKRVGEDSSANDDGAIVLDTFCDDDEDSDDEPLVIFGASNQNSSKAKKAETSIETPEKNYTNSDSVASDQKKKKSNKKSKKRS